MNKDNNMTQTFNPPIKPLKTMSNNELLDYYEEMIIGFCTTSKEYNALERELAITPIRLELRRRAGIIFEFK